MNNGDREHSKHENREMFKRLTHICQVFRRKEKAPRCKENNGKYNLDGLDESGKHPALFQFDASNKPALMRFREDGIGFHKYHRSFIFLAFLSIIVYYYN